MHSQKMIHFTSYPAIINSIKLALCHGWKSIIPVHLAEKNSPLMISTMKIERDKHLTTQLNNSRITIITMEVTLAVEGQLLIVLIMHDINHHHYK